MPEVLHQLLSPFTLNTNKHPGQFLGRAGVGGFIPTMVTGPALTGCNSTSRNLDWCKDLTNFAFFGPSKLMRSGDMPLVVATWPAGVSTR
jgi:hypothetical protein